MPETTMDEHGYMMSWQDYVRLPRQLSRMKAVTQSRCVQIATDDQFWASIGPTNPRHSFASMFRGEAIGHRRRPGLNFPPGAASSEPVSRTEKDPSGHLAPRYPCVRNSRAWAGG